MGLRMAAIGATGSKGRCLFSLQQVHLFGDQIGTRQSGLERKPGVCFVVETGPEAAAGSRILEQGQGLISPGSFLVRATALLGDQRPLPFGIP